MLPESMLDCLRAFRSCFTSPTHERFLTVMTGWLLCTGNHTITGVVHAASVASSRHHSGYHRVFSNAVWCPDREGHRLA